MLNFIQNDICVFFVKSVVSLPYLNGTVMTGGSAIINTNSWAVELNGQHELYESNLETKYILFKFRKIDFTEKILPKEFFRESKLTKFITIPV